MSYKDKAFYGSSPPCIISNDGVVKNMVRIILGDHGPCAVMCTAEANWRRHRDTDIDTKIIKTKTKTKK